MFIIKLKAIICRILSLQGMISGSVKQEKETRTDKKSPGKGRGL